MVFTLLTNLENTAVSLHALVKCYQSNVVTFTCLYVTIGHQTVFLSCQCRKTGAMQQQPFRRRTADSLPVAMATMCKRRLEKTKVNKSDIIALCS